MASGSVPEDLAGSGRGVLGAVRGEATAVWKVSVQAGQSRIWGRRLRPQVWSLESGVCVRTGVLTRSFRFELSTGWV